MKSLLVRVLTPLVLAHAASAGILPKHKPPAPVPLDDYVREATRPPEGESAKPSPGSVWSPSAQYADLGRDLKACQVNDIVTIVVDERASAVSTGSTKTQRKSAASAQVNALGGVTRATGPLANLAGMSGNQSLQGDGTTSRQTTLATTVTARVVRVLPNGGLVLEGAKEIQVNSEFQKVTVRGVARPADLQSDNSVRSDRLAQMEVRLNGKGVVNDAVRRPNFLYRLLMGVLPF